MDMNAKKKAQRDLEAKREAEARAQQAKDEAEELERSQATKALVDSAFVKARSGNIQESLLAILEIQAEISSKDFN